MNSIQTQIELGVGDAKTPATEMHSSRAHRLYRVVGILCFFAARFAFGIFLLITSVYCLLFFIPFTYFGFIHNPLLAWLPVFVRIHAYLYSALLGAVAITLAPKFHDHRTKRSAFAFLLLHAAVGMYLLFRPALGSMTRDIFPYIWSMLSLFPLMWLAALDLTATGQPMPNTSARTLDLPTATLAGLAVGLVFAATSFLRAEVQHNDAGSAVASLTSIGASLVLHTVLFAGFALVVQFIAAVAKKTAWPEPVSFWLNRAWVWLIAAAAIRYIAFPTISFDGLQAGIFASIASLAFVLYSTAITVEIRRKINSATQRGSGFVWPWWFKLLAGLALIGLAYEVPALIGPTDWDFVLQKFSVLLLWGAAIALIRWPDRWLRTRSVRVGTVLLLICAGVAFAAFRISVSASASDSGESERSAALDEYAGADISFKTAYDILSRSVHDDAYSDFYRFLRQHTNLPRDAVPGPANIKLVDSLAPTVGTKPNIFLFVIDSLRQDYVSAYNPSVTFTPVIGQFARDSVVMQNAFSRYAGTALSEPAIWVGAMQLHEQYIEPFYPMNSLQKLLETDGYESYVSLDPILQMITHPDSTLNQLDKETRQWNDLDFCPTLKELESRIDARHDRKPIFAYTQPQNVHTLTLERSRKHGTRREISIAELQRMDSAFGEFIEFLKARGLYDNSIIILTSDHGDSYGEFGRYGHADFLFPEVIRIPLIIHLPPAMRQQFVWDTQQVAFSLDITPSLYYLLGHGPVAKDELFGRPLFTRSREELTSYLRPNYLLVSSYAPVYGVLDGSGKSLFVVDAVNQKNYFYDFANDPEGLHNRVTPQIRDRNESIIRREVGLIDNFYHYAPAARR